MKHLLPSLIAALSAVCFLYAVASSVVFVVAYWLALILAGLLAVKPVKKLARQLRKWAHAKPQSESD